MNPDGSKPYRLTVSRRAVCAGLAAASLAPFPALAADWPRGGEPELSEPTIVGPIPVTATSKPFGSALTSSAYSAKLVRDFDYVEEEYFVSGHANVYGPGTTQGLTALAEGPDRFAGTRSFATAKMQPLAKVVQPGMPYMTRVLMVRPRDAAKFSGRVHLYTFHNLATALPVERNLLENGDAIAGLEGCSGTRFGPEEIPSGGIAQLHKFDLLRYRDLRLADASPAAWPDLTPGTLGQAAKSLSFSGSGRASDVFQQEIYRSYAQAPDIVSQVARALKTGRAGFPFGGKVRHLYSFAASGGSTFLQPYIQYHHAAAMLPDGRPPYDGYLIMVGLMPAILPKGAVMAYLNSEADLGTAIRQGTVFPPDSNEPRLRVYEIPGTGHGISAPLPEISAAQEGTALHGAGSVVPHGVAGLSDRDAPPDGVLPYDKINAPIVWALWANMYAWVERGVPMPSAPRILRDPKSPDGIAHDANGHALGGLRTPWVDVPDANYLPRISPKNPLQAGLRPFPEEKMKQLYGSREAYLRRVNRRIDELVKQRFVQARHADLMRRTDWGHG